ncbi:unnamed protein product [Owenia fusiformis]|uniref:Uncharacterized protein n=2 Tax=Owenia fusiformis TaxID=6347 RepID=A0A8J1TN92_OWEFU|nr:unnamed protein product [Owenia fusiformis]
MGLVTFDNFVYEEFFLNTYNSSSQIASHIERMDIHPDNDNMTRCGRRRDLALISAKTLQLTSDQGIRDPMGIENPPIKQEVLIITTDGVTLPKYFAPDTIKEGGALKQDTRAEVFVISLSIEESKDGIDEFSAIASQPTDDFLIKNDFDTLLPSLEKNLGCFCVNEITI